MRTCGNCFHPSCLAVGNNNYISRPACSHFREPREPTELEKAQWWFCGWRRCGKENHWTKYRVNQYKAIDRLEAAIRANAWKGIT